MQKMHSDMFGLLLLFFLFKGAMYNSRFDSCSLIFIDRLAESIIQGLFACVGV